ncbi:uncharacterized protein F5Z01DRAFT_340805 [Emericellopsis atlantica]|uniref:Thioesterase atnL n=1 Tax=Emericellopsis atlantica TaxID=2614577 RepID=A0A9P7ZG28_9HYPO|nr:uncharacterized protein F5Z01DRAFT_340805 [Emericellopsis atlantica]KAG9250818.1 hypothetical protein F5Z01DRAFT_340805 [Emericellopsis atlantica]
MGIWIWLLALLAVFNIKNIPFSWSVRFFRALGCGMLLHRKAKAIFKPHHVFLPAVSTTRSPLMEIDFNLHKSNSTFFTDLDVSRAYLSGVLLGPLFLHGIDGQRCNMIVGNVACSFRREIKPYRPYETWTRIASWDEKWIYMVTHFVEKRTDRPARCALLPETKTVLDEKPTVSEGQKGDRIVFASAVTQFVCKKGRMTVPPARALAECGLIQVEKQRDEGLDLDSLRNDPSLMPQSRVSSAGRSKGSPAEDLNSYLPRDLEMVRAINMPVVRLIEGWDRVHALFCEDEGVLGLHRDVI